MKGIKKVYFREDYQIWTIVFTDGTMVNGNTKEEACQNAIEVLLNK